jgi:hypothetical protein
MPRPPLSLNTLRSSSRRGKLRSYTTFPFSFSGFTDPASTPVVRDALVPIVIEQTVSPLRLGLLWDEMVADMWLGRVEVNGAMISIRGSSANE